MVKDYVVGIDIGATNLKFGLIKRQRIIFKKTLPTSDFPSRDSLIAGICEGIESILLASKISKAKILGVGVGLPGAIDPKRGIAHYLPNLKGWDNVPARRLIQKKVALPIFIENDANLMVLAEARLGSAQGKKNVIGITLGTGVGGGILVNGTLYRGSGFAAGEIGHIPLNEVGPRCNCGGGACLERYIGNRHILKKAIALFGKDISLERLSLLAKQGNQKAKAIWQEAARHLGICLCGVVNFLNPEAIVIGGGISGAGRLILDTVRRTIKTRAMPVQAKTVKILKAKLGNDAGMIGAGFLVREAFIEGNP